LGDGVWCFSFLSLERLVGLGDLDSVDFSGGTPGLILGGGVCDCLRFRGGVGDFVTGFALAAIFLVLSPRWDDLEEVRLVLAFFLGGLSSDEDDVSRFDLVFLFFLRRVSVDEELLELESSLDEHESEEVVELSVDGLLSFFVFLSFLRALFSIFICNSSSLCNSCLRFSRSSGSASANSSGSH
jgi:hypothetical protein